MRLADETKLGKTKAAAELSPVYSQGNSWGDIRDQDTNTHVDYRFLANGRACASDPLPCAMAKLTLPFLATFQIFLMTGS